ncbi:MAG: AAA family ATPase [Candidatus Falkowbacteria bacterium]
MYLEKLEIQGFKSFASKNTLVFPGMLNKERRGITAIVGPNGSGKSNTADAVRWALGEQSMKTLRGKKGEDVIFSGSDKKGKLGMSEVSLFLNNEDKKNNIDYSQIILTRRLYRNGDSEYLINNSRARLADVQILLAKAKFGQKTYSVIGQGMVEGFLNTSLTERKEFFDEATGVKQFQIKRDDSLNKLRASHENLNQAQMLIDEIEPRLKTLTRQVNKLQKREEIEKELKNLQLNHYSNIWHGINREFNKYNSQFLEIEKEKIEKEKKLKNLNHDLDKIKSQESATSEFNNLQKELILMQNQKDEIIKQLAKIEAQKEIKFEASGRFDLSFLSSRKNELENELKKIAEEINDTQKNYNSNQLKIKKLEDGFEIINKKLNNANNDLKKLTLHIGEDEEENINAKLQKTIDNLLDAEKENDIKKIKIIINRIADELNEIIKKYSKNKNEQNLKNLQNEILKLTEKKEEIFSEINNNRVIISALLEKIKLFKENKEKIEIEIENIKNKFKENKNPDSQYNKKEEENLKIKIEKINKEITEIKEKINSYAQKEEEKRNYLFSLQKELQNLQNEINLFNNQLNELKINSTRYETKLENLEIEIRNSFISLQEVKNHNLKLPINSEEIIEKINQLKRQLDLIGGIDPEIEKEYKETKERFDFLDGQVDDLKKPLTRLKKLLKSLTR